LPACTWFNWSSGTMITLLSAPWPRGHLCNLTVYRYHTKLPRPRVRARWQRTDAVVSSHHPVAASACVHSGHEYTLGMLRLAFWPVTVLGVLVLRCSRDGATLLLCFKRPRYPQLKVRQCATAPPSRKRARSRAHGKLSAHIPEGPLTSGFHCFWVATLLWRAVISDSKLGHWPPATRRLLRVLALASLLAATPLAGLLLWIKTGVASVLLAVGQRYLVWPLLTAWRDVAVAGGTSITRSHHRRTWR